MISFFFQASGGNQPTGVRSGIPIPEPPWVWQNQLVTEPTTSSAIFFLKLKSGLSVRHAQVYQTISSVLKAITDGKLVYNSMVCYKLGEGIILYL